MDIVQAIMFATPMAKFHFEGDMEMTGAEGKWVYKNLVWDDLFFPKPSEEQLQQWYDMSVKAYADPAGDYRSRRKEHYPTAEQQLAIIYDQGLEGWRSYIDNIKKNIPKPKVE